MIFSLAFSDGRPDFSKLVLGPKDTFEAGWLPDRKRTAKQSRMHDRILSQAPRFALASPIGEPKVGDQSLEILDCMKTVNGGKHPLPFLQYTGSCVGQGGGRVQWSLGCVERILKGERENPLLPFYLHTYGKSRARAGLRGRGEGCFGSAYAEAARLDGILPSDLSGLPARESGETISWPAAIEYEWSDGAAIPQSFVAKGREFLVRTTSPMRSADDVREAIRAGYPVTIASNWGGQMACKQAGTPAVLLNRRATTWNHQMCLLAWWWHPTLGEIYWCQNSWGNPHGVDAIGPPGGFWIAKADVEYIVAQDDSWAFSQFNGFPLIANRLIFRLA